MQMEIGIDLLNYGVLGAWTLFLLYEKRVLLKRLTDSLDKLNKNIEESN